MMNATNTVRELINMLKYGSAMGVIVASLCAGKVDAQCTYELTAVLDAPVNCGILGPVSTEATAINDHGVVTGSFDCLFTPKPFMWSEETGFLFIQLPPNVPTASPMDINNCGEIVGWMDPAGSVQERAFHWHNGVWTDLGVLPGSTQSRAFAINDRGEIVGEMANIITGPTRAFLFRDRVLAPLELPLGPNSSANDLNSSTTVVGWMGEGGGNFAAGFQQQDRDTIGIPIVSPDDWNQAVAINEKGVIVGVSVIPVTSGTVKQQSWMFDNGTLTDLGSLPNINHIIQATGINDVGQIVGTARRPSPGKTSAPFLWQHGVMYDLSMLVVGSDPELLIRAATGINNHGTIIGRALIGTSNVSVVLTPINRPLGDVNIDCLVDEHDLIAILEDWGPNRSGYPTDIVTSATFAPPSDGRVDAADLAVVLGNWTIPSPNIRSSAGASRSR